MVHIFPLFNYTPNPLSDPRCAPDGFEKLRRVVTDPLFEDRHDVPDVVDGRRRISLDQYHARLLAGGQRPDGPGQPLADGENPGQKGRGVHPPAVEGVDFRTACPYDGVALGPDARP